MMMINGREYNSLHTDLNIKLHKLSVLINNYFRVIINLLLTSSFLSVAITPSFLRQNVSKKI
uniref:Uncharacterized protein n=1 Tax=Strongyloides papillosus TaxID=174720 RepID=A0A0N5BYF5_STREA